MKIDYDHSRNLHSLEGPRAALSQIFAPHVPSSILDVGCGIGVWLRASMDMGISDVLGIDGVGIPTNQLLFPSELFLQKDLTTPVDLFRKFELVLCVEVAEHLEIKHAPAFVRMLTQHADTVMFSAACPGQPGQHHVNCQWPSWWQRLFNENGFACDDQVRWTIWEDTRIEPWYRQNLFIARRDHNASQERRLAAVIHPEMIARMARAHTEAGLFPIPWQIQALSRSVVQKLSRRLTRLISKRKDAAVSGADAP